MPLLICNNHCNIKYYLLKFKWVNWARRELLASYKFGPSQFSNAAHGRGVFNDSKVRFPYSCGPAIGHRLVRLPRSKGLTFRPSSSFGIDNNYPVKLLELVKYKINLEDLSRNASNDKLRIQALWRCEEPVTAKIILRRLKREGESR